MMKPEFNVSPCVLCSNTDYVQAPFTKLQVDDHHYQAVFICKICGMTPFFATGKQNEHRNFAEENYYESGAYTVYHPSLLSRVDDCIAYLNARGYLRHRSLLDVGCGEGYLLEKAKESGAEVTGLEPNKSVCKRLQQRGLRVVQGFGEDYPLGEQFDVITLFWVLDATRNPIAVLTRMRSLTKNDGILVLQLGSVYKVPLVIQRPMEFVVKTQKSAPDYHPFYFTRTSVKACLQSAGFEVIEEPKRYSTNNFFLAKAAKAKSLSEIDVGNWRSLYLFFVLWRLRDWLLFNGATRPVYRRLDLERWKNRLKKWLLAASTSPPTSSRD